jgi:hypothetical protein
VPVLFGNDPETVHTTVSRIRRDPKWAANNYKASREIAGLF